MRGQQKEQAPVLSAVDNIASPVRKRSSYAPEQIPAAPRFAHVSSEDAAVLLAAAIAPVEAVPRRPDIAQSSYTLISALLCLRQSGCLDSTFNKRGLCSFGLRGLPRGVPLAPRRRGRMGGETSGAAAGAWHQNHGPLYWVGRSATGHFVGLWRALRGIESIIKALVPHGRPQRSRCMPVCCTQSPLIPVLGPAETTPRVTEDLLFANRV